MDSHVKLTQLDLMGRLEASTITVTIHLERGRPDRTWWITGTSDTEDTILTWSDRTSPGPHGDLNLAELMTALMDVFRLTRLPGEE